MAATAIYGFFSLHVVFDSFRLNIALIVELAFQDGSYNHVGAGSCFLLQCFMRKGWVWHVPASSPYRCNIELVSHSDLCIFFFKMNNPSRFMYVFTVENELFSSVYCVNQIFCSNCCSIKASVSFLDNKEARVCSKCYQDLVRGSYSTCSFCRFYLQILWIIFNKL